MASVRIEDEAFSDSRIELLGSIAGYNRFEALGRLSHLWRICTQRGLYVVSHALVVATMGERGPEALIGSELGEACELGFRVRGTEGRIEWLAAKRAAAKAGGEAKRSRMAAKTKPNASQRKPNASHMAGNTQPTPCPLTLTLTPTVAVTVASTEIGDSAPPRAELEPAGDHQAVVTEFTEFYKRTHGGAAPTWDAKTGGMVKALLRKHPRAEVVRRMVIAERAPPKFPAAPYDLNAFIHHFDKFAMAAADVRDVRFGSVAPRPHHEYPDGEVEL